MKKTFSIIAICFCLSLTLTSCTLKDNNGGYSSNSQEFTLSDAYDLAESKLRQEISSKFNSSSATIEVSSRSYKKDNDEYKITLYGNASGYTDKFNDKFNIMTFTFKASVDVSEDGLSGWCYHTDLDYDWKYPL